LIESFCAASNENLFQWVSFEQMASCAAQRPSVNGGGGTVINL
jgi:hypothetical protein